MENIRCRSKRTSAMFTNANFLFVSLNSFIINMTVTWEKPWENWWKYMQFAVKESLLSFKTDKFNNNLYSKLIFFNF